MMTEAVLEKEVCMSCGADVRDGTYYCYACGKPVVTEPDNPESVNASDTATIVDDQIGPKEEKTAKLTTAANERKKSRAGRRKPKQVVWEEPGDSSNRIFVVFSLLIFIIAVAVVYLTVFTK